MIKTVPRRSFRFTRSFETHFGLSPVFYSQLGPKVNRLIPNDALPKHLLFTLHFLHVYSSLDVASTVYNADKKQ